MAGEPFYRYADLVGDGTGSKSMNVDGSVTAQVFKLMPREDTTSDYGYDDEHRIEVHKAFFYIEDAGNMFAANFGALAALTNGFTVGHFDANGNLIRCLCDSVPLKTNAAFARVMYDVTFHTFGSGNNMLAARWTLNGAGPAIILNGKEYLGVVINDNLTGLVDFTCQFQGVAYK